VTTRSAGPRRLLLVRLSAFGDVVFCLPAAKALKSAFPDAELAWAVEENLVPLLRGAPYVDRLLPTRTRRWRRAPVALRGEIRSFLREARAFAPDVIIDAQGLFKSAWVTALVPAPRKVGFGRRTATERVNLLATRERVDPVGRAHVADRMLALAERVAGRGGFDPLPDVSHLVAAPDAAVDAFVAAAGGPFALLQPFASKAAKEWGAERFAALARALAARGLRPAVLWGPGEEARARAIAAASDALLAPPTGPAAAARLASRAALFVGGDTGPTQLAAAAGAPTVALFGPTDPERYAPRGPRVSVAATTGRYNGILSRSSRPDVDEVLERARRLGSLP
jgi:lipopolysaccharide heptosyltransferase I